MFVLNGNQERVIRSIKTFGFNEYESRALFTLQIVGECTALELSRKSGIPQSKVYSIIYRLVDQKAAIVKEGNPMTVRPLKVSKCFGRIQSKTQRRMERGRCYIERLAVELAPLARRYNKMRVFAPTYNSR